MNTCRCRVGFSSVVLIVASTISFDAYSDTLVQQMDTLFGENGIRLDATPVVVNGQNFAHTAHFSSASLQALGTLTSTLAPSSADFPVISTSPGVNFTYNAELQAFEPSTTTSGGSVFVERGQTLGAGRFAAGLSYMYIDYQQLNGRNLDGYTLQLTHNQFPIPGNPHPSFEDATIDVRFQKFNLTSHVISAYATYGITDKWDVNVLLPVMVTDMDLQATATINDVPFQGRKLHYFNRDNKTISQTYSTSGHKVGVGDLQIRTKYQFVASDGLNISGLLRVRFPTGNEDNFQSLGDTIVAPYFALSQVLGDFDLHANGGFDIDVNYADRSRARYGIGVTYQFMPKAAFMVDVIGSSNLTNQAVKTKVPQFTTPTGPATSVSTVTSQLSTNIVDLAMGFRANPAKNMTAYFNFLVPLTNDGLRADFIPVAGLEMAY